MVFNKIDKREEISKNPLTKGRKGDKITRLSALESRNGREEKTLKKVKKLFKRVLTRGKESGIITRSPRESGETMILEN